jgi:hypothetical protein
MNRWFHLCFLILIENNVKKWKLLKNSLINKELERKSAYLDMVLSNCGFIKIDETIDCSVGSWSSNGHGNSKKGDDLQIAQISWPT